METDTAKQKENINIEMMKISRAFKAGAKALIFVTDPLNPDKSWFDMAKGRIDGGMYKMKGKSARRMPGTIIFGNNEIAEKIVEETGKTLEELQLGINKTGTPNSFELQNTTAEIHLGKKVEPAYGKNVLAIMEGSDPLLKNECVVLTAHYDHIGMNSKGEIFNGADDNGSGTVALLEIAEAFTKMKNPPKRSIVFAWVTAEEKGLFGSYYYLQHPVFPLDKTLVDINMDMIGRSAKKEPEKDASMENTLCGPNGLYIVSGGQSSALTKISNDICKQLNLIPSDAMTKDFLNRSDYYHFYKNGIPVLGVYTGLHEDYHKPSDELDKIDYNKMKRVSQYCFLVANKVANQKKRIVVDNPVPQK